MTDLVVPRVGVGFPSVVVENVSMVYRTPTVNREVRKNTPFLKQILGSAIGRAPRENVVAVDDLSFVARTGEFIGLLGANGAGKSTIMRIIAGVETPTSGNVYVNRQPALLGVSAALIPELSGIENARIGCLALGMTKEEADAKLPDIIDFAGIGDAIYRPMKTYSSGMGARLRFAISTANRPEILLIDEALSTGDASFQEKSQARMQEMLNTTGTIFLVSHNSILIEEMCNRALWLHQGRIISDGDAREVARAYRWWAWCVANGDLDKAERAIKSYRDEFVPQSIKVIGSPGQLKYTGPRHRVR
ncbi:teichoic acid transport system ATP-binding protein [Arcanobacterium pluranimalium]|uniref:ABC transporter ATP-binding protein n=1 Tax=Arcanobacterium pluranimalium TaxID=108028 RepID=UPI00195860BD|nr:ABC transporter ATP-binding protein [Arcanobacterium pluranimalium]MBM7824602.1 teichoic acid transport system ATP-binding protein [Arcanobacterium pluranimalium]